MYLILTLILFVTPAFSSTVSELAYSHKWLKLLHYKKNWTSGYESQADGKEFFLHPEGKHNPKAELERSIELFSKNPKPTDDDPACKFPLRMKWINQQLNNPWKIDLSGCHRYTSFYSKLAARRATIVFSSYYLSNPNSAFGHTLLRLSRFDDRNETEMLDYGINYSAQARATDPFSYAIKGLVGGFKGRFAAIPYYYKIREYSNSEFRDLWSYDLKLSPSQVLEMVDHIWELGQTWFDHFYFHENCSYHLLSILDVVIPDSDLTGKYSVFTIPADTIRLLEQEKLIEEGKRRESTYSKLVRISAPLENEELAAAKKIAKDPSAADKILKEKNDKEAAAILDVALEAFDYYNSEKILADDPATKEAKHPLLTARAVNPVITEDKEGELDKNLSPARSNSPTRLTIAQGYEHQRGNTTRFEFRAALHDLLDPPQGSLQEAQLELGEISLSHREWNYKGGEVFLDQVSIFNIKNYPQQNFWSSPLSWEVDVGARQLTSVNCKNCLAGFASGSVGNSFEMFDRKLLFALLLNGEARIHNYYRENFQMGLGPKVFIRARFNENVVTGINLHYHLTTSAWKEYLTDQELFSDWETRFKMSDRGVIFLKTSGIERERKWVPAVEAGLQYFYH